MNYVLNEYSLNENVGFWGKDTTIAANTQKNIRCRIKKIAVPKTSLSDGAIERTAERLTAEERLVRFEEAVRRLAGGL